MSFPRPLVRLRHDHARREGGIIPGLKQIDCFAGFISLVDEENRRARSVVLWETQEGADEAERRFGPKREEIVRGMGGTVRSADLYEAPIVEVHAGVRA